MAWDAIDASEGGCAYAFRALAGREAESDRDGEAHEKHTAQAIGRGASGPGQAPPEHG